jgi:hypothetical protein
MQGFIGSAAMRLEKKERLSVGINAEQILSSFSSVCRFWVVSQ